MNFGARAEIRLDAIRHNLNTIRKRAPAARIMAVVKANAYGHGLLPVAACLDEADCLAVARLPEAAHLRDAGIVKPLAVLGGIASAEDLAAALAMELEIGVHNHRQVEWLERHGTANAIAWVKVDTGMNRLGFRVHEAPDIIARLRRCDSVATVRLMTHFANADDLHDDTTLRQLAAFSKLLSDFDGVVSIANSPGIFGWQDQIASASASQPATWLRPGLSLYGVSPFPDGCGSDLGLQPAMRFESQLMAVKPLGRGERVGYGGTWTSGRETTLGIIAVGYGDGYSRNLPSGTPVIVNGRSVSLAGRVSMDLTAVDLGPNAGDDVGDRVVLWGEELPVEEIARHASTISYELLCGVTDRVERIYS